jgi:hypothetical protein
MVLCTRNDHKTVELITNLMSGFWFHFCCLCATSVDVVHYSLYCNLHYMFRLNWQCSGAQVACLRELLFCFSTVIAAMANCQAVYCHSIKNKHF